MAYENLVGTWTLDVNAPFFGKQTLTLKLTEENGALHGSVSHSMGGVELTNIEANDSEFSAAAALDVGGKKYEARVNGQAEGDEMNGAIKVNMAFVPAVKFTGTRA